MGVVGMRWKPSRVFVGGAVLEGLRAADIDAMSTLLEGLVMLIFIWKLSRRVREVLYCTVGSFVVITIFMICF